MIDDSSRFEWPVPLKNEKAQAMKDSFENFLQS